MDQILAAYKALLARRPELAQGQIVQHVSLELKRAKRTDEEERFYRDTISGANQLVQIAGVIGIAAERGDSDGVTTLADRWERLQSGRAQQYYYTGTFYFNGPWDAIEQCMAVRAEKKAHADVLKLLDYGLTAARRRLATQSPASTRAARTRYANQGNAPGYQIWTGKTTRYMQIAFPLPNEYMDEHIISLLRSAYELYKTADLLTDLTGHFRDQVKAAKTPAEALYPQLALTSIYWWNGDKEQAIAELTTVALASKPESDLRLDLAELLEQQGERGDALTIVDAVQPLDNATMKRREEIALRLAVMTGDLERARMAAERLFGLRLDTETQVRLAGQMNQLGQHELAEAVLGRAPPRRQQGDRACGADGPVSKPGQARHRRADRHADSALDHRRAPDQPQLLLPR